MGTLPCLRSYQDVSDFLSNASARIPGTYVVTIDGPLKEADHHISAAFPYDDPEIMRYDGTDELNDENGVVLLDSFSVQNWSLGDPRNIVFARTAAAAYPLTEAQVAALDEKMTDSFVIPVITGTPEVESDDS